MICVKRFLAAASAALALMGLSASALSAQPDEVVLAPPPSTTSALTHIGPGDQLKVDIFNQPELSTSAGVGEDGSIRMPLVGSVTVSGMQQAEAAKKIEDAYKYGEFLVDPHVTVSVTSSVSQRVTVMDQVRSPGRYPIDPSTTVLDLLAMAGGMTEFGWEVVDIERHDAGGKVQHLSVDIRGTASGGSGAATTVSLQGGDIVRVKRGTFRITGAVKSAGEYKVLPDMVLLEAIAVAGDITDVGSASRVEIQRKDANGKFVQVKKVKKDTPILPGDLIKVKERLW